MTEHPLTDAKCRDIANNLCFRWQPHVHQDEVLYGEDDMRSAADWQLEQCIAWLDDTDCDDPQETAQRLREAMRPTQENN